MLTPDTIGRRRRPRAPRTPSVARDLARRAAPAAGLALALAGCAEEPSFYLRWTITEDPQLVYDAPDGAEAAPLASALDCSAVGVQRVRVNIYEDGTQFADRFVRSHSPIEPTDAWLLATDKKIYPCFPSEFADADAQVGGPELAPGTYVAHVMALRRDGSPWPCDAATGGDEGETSGDGDGDGACAEGEGDLSCPPGYHFDTDEQGAPIVDGCYAVCVRNCPLGEQEDDAGECVLCPGHTVTPSFEVTEDGTPPRLGSFTLLAPRQCIDGVDNDGDGRTDVADPACQFDPLAREDHDSGVTLFDLSLSLLGNPSTECSDVGIDHLRAHVATEDGGEVDLGELPCVAHIPVFTKSLPAGTHTLRVTGIAGDDTPMTTEKVSEPFTVEETAPSYVQESIDLTDEDFLEPIVSSIEVAFAFYSHAESGTAWSCVPPLADGALLGEIETMSLQIRNGDGALLGAAELGIEGAVDGANGVDLASCPTAPVESGDLTWGAYSIAAQGSIGGVACFATAQDFALAPNSFDAVFLDRIVDDEGVPPEGCWSCEDDGDCGGSYACVGHICKDD